MVVVVAVGGPHGAGGLHVRSLPHTTTHRITRYHTQVVGPRRPKCRTCVQGDEESLSLLEGIMNFLLWISVVSIIWGVYHPI